MNHWFRVYNTLVDDPKVQQLPETLFKALMNLWCVASQNDGILPCAEDIGYKLRVKPQKAAEFVTRLVAAGLIDNVDGVFIPHNWDGRQFQSDTSTERVKRHRDKKRNASRNDKRNVPETPDGTDRAEQIKTDSEQSTAEPAALDENGLKQESALKSLFSSTRSGLGLAVPNLDHIKIWLLGGIAAGTISGAVTPMLNRKADMVSLAYCDSAVREAHVKAQLAPSLEPVPLTDADWRSTVKRYKGNRSLWSRHAGPEPGMAGCRCPIVILIEAQIDPATGFDMTASWHFIDHTTNEMAAFIHDAQTRKVRPPVVLKFELDGVERTGFFSQIPIPPGYDEATGERIAPKESEDAA